MSLKLAVLLLMLALHVAARLVRGPRRADLLVRIGMGLLLAFTRRNPFVSRSPYVVKWSGE